ncbi:uncharacterized protein [Setaria viridis]|uniref:uncharacterized protein n=1 Tax=Setaria viridis TaxID=4556 RepID=UPI003B3B4AE2
MEGRLVITEVTDEGRPVAPEKVAKKYVSQIGAIVRDNVPISIREWKGRSDNPYALPETEKNMLWEDVKRHFTFPEDYSEKDVKAWTLKKMATQFQTFKKMLDTHYIKKGKTPDFNAWPKLRDHWDAFVEYKRSEEGVKKITTNVANASQKGYHHHLGRGGYGSAIPKWRKMEQDLIERGIIPATIEWPERSKNWYYAHGGSLSQEDGTLIFNDRIREKAEHLMKNIEDSKAGRLRVDRENDELTLALGNPEHPGRCRGFGVVPWKFAFRGDSASYRSRKRRKEQMEESWRQMLEQRMMDEINRRVADAVAELAQSGALPNPHTASPSQRLGSSCASTGVPDAQTPRLPVEEQRFHVDAITQRTSCELHAPVGNLTIKVYLYIIFMQSCQLIQASRSEFNLFTSAICTGSVRECVTNAGRAEQSWHGHSNRLRQRLRRANSRCPV